MNVLLISANTAVDPYPVYPLGMSMVAAALRNAGHTVRLFDCLQQPEDALRALLQREKFGLAGISIRNIDNVNSLHEERYVDGLRKLVDLIHADAGIKVVLGGAGFSIMPELLLRTTGADYGIAGEGEELFPRFVADAERGVYPERNCLYAGTRLRGRAIPPAWYDPELVQYYLQRGHICSVQTKRGCPYRCVYCSYPALEGHELRPRDPGEVAHDVERLAAEHGAQCIFFTDSVFNDDDGLYLDVVRELKRRGLRVPWTAFFKPGNLGPAEVALMKETGLKGAEIGADAATDTTLAGLGKNFTFHDVDATNNLFLDHGVPTAHYFMFGCPGETEATVHEGIANMKLMRKSASFVFMGIRILPDTPLVTVAERDGIIRPGQELLESVYYLSPLVDKDWMEKTLTEAFARIRHIVFPPDAINSTLQFLHSLGYSGMLWEMLAADRPPRGKAHP